MRGGRGAASAASRSPYKNADNEPKSSDKGQSDKDERKKPTSNPKQKDMTEDEMNKNVNLFAALSTEEDDQQED